MQEERREEKSIVINHVGMTYSGIAGNVEALRDVSLRIEPGEFICLVGPSGCGKTTLLNVIAGFLEPTAGEVSIDGRKVEGPGPVRLSQPYELESFYPKLGDWLKQRFAGWRAYIFTGDARVPKLIGLSPSKRTPLFNGALECRLYEFKIVRGTMRKSESSPHDKH